jgi:hypothetical protein
MENRPYQQNGYAARLNEHDRRLGILEPQMQRVIGDIREIRVSTSAMAEDIKEIRAQAERREDQDAQAIRFRITTTIAIIAAILVAAGIVSSAL